MDAPERHALLAMLALCALGVALAAASLRPDRSSIQERLEHGFPLRVGYALEPPYAYIDSEDRLRGESVDVLQSALEQLGVESVRHVRVDFGSLVEELEAGRIDVIAGGLFITEERQKRVRFTRPTAAVGTALLLREAAPTGHTLRLAVIEGSVEAAKPERLVDGPHTVLPLPDARTAMAALSLGEADAIALSAPSLRWMARHSASPDTLVLQPVDAPRSGFPAFALARSEIEFTGRLDTALAHYLGSAEHLQTVAPYGFLESDVRPALDWQAKP